MAERKMSTVDGTQACPFLVNTPRSNSPGPAPFSPPMQPHIVTPQPERPMASVPISIVVEKVVHEQLGLPNVDVAPWVQKLEKNLIMNFTILCQLNPALLARLELPLALENGLVQIIEAHFRGVPGMGNTSRAGSLISQRKGSTRSLKMKKKEPDQKSALLGISEDMRKAIKESWALISAKPTGASLGPEQSNLNKFFDLFYKNFLENDRTARRLFEGVSMVRQAQALMKIMGMIMQAIDNPTKLVQPLRKLGARHLIYGVERKNFQAWGIALAKTVESVLGEKCSPATKEGWYVLIQALGEMMMIDYDEIRVGYPGKLYRKDGTKWRLYYTNMTHESLTLYKDEERTKIKDDYDLSIIDCMDLEDGDLPNGAVRFNNFCFSVTASSLVKYYFCAETEDDLLWWTDELTQRIRGHQKLNKLGNPADGDNKPSSSDSDDSLDSSAESDAGAKKPGLSKSKAAKKLKHLKHALGKKSSKTNL